MAVKVEPINQGESYAPLRDRLASVASAVGMEEISVITTGLAIVEVKVTHPETKAVYDWTGAVEGRSDDDIVVQFTLWVASVR